MNVLLLGVTLTVGAPAIKDPPPKKDAGIYGEWVVQSMTMGGKQNARAPAETIYQFTPEGQWLIRREGATAKSVPRDIKIDAKASPATIDVVYPMPAAGGAAPRNMLGIYRIDGDTLTLCFSPGGGERPTAFESPDGARVMLMTLKRKKKE
jgi:uncharacterized protein (TIGR03067 family)